MALGSWSDLGMVPKSQGGYSDASGEEWDAYFKRKQAEEQAASNIGADEAAGLGVDPLQSYVYGGMEHGLPPWAASEKRRVSGLQSPDIYGAQGDIDRQMDWAKFARERAQGRGLQSSMAYDAARRAAQSGAESYARSGGYGSSLARRAAQEMSMAGQGMAGERAQAEQLERDQWAKQYAQWMADAQKASYADADLRNKWAMERERMMGEMTGRGMLQNQRRYSGALGTLEAKQLHGQKMLGLDQQDQANRDKMIGQFLQGGGSMIGTLADGFGKGSEGSRGSRGYYTEDAETAPAEYIE